jgi:hypothetical protein
MNFPVQQNFEVLAGNSKTFQLNALCDIPHWVSTNFTSLVMMQQTSNYLDALITYWEALLSKRLII